MSQAKSGVGLRSGVRLRLAARDVTLPSDPADILGGCPCSSSSISSRRCRARSATASRGLLPSGATSRRPSPTSSSTARRRGRTSAEDEIVSLALIRLAADGVEAGRFTRLVRPIAADPRRGDGRARHRRRGRRRRPAVLRPDGAAAPTSSTAGSSSPTTRASTSACSGSAVLAPRRSRYETAAVACTLEAFRLLDPLADNHRLAVTLRPPRDRAPRRARRDKRRARHRPRYSACCSNEGDRARDGELDHERLHGPPLPRRYATPPSPRSAASSGWPVRPGSSASTAAPIASRSPRSSSGVAGTGNMDALTRAQVQDVYDALEELIADRHRWRLAASA